MRNERVIKYETKNKSKLLLMATKLDKIDSQIIASHDKR